jgi:hypothetical protein
LFMSFLLAPPPPPPALPIFFVFWGVLIKACDLEIIWNNGDCCCSADRSRILLIKINYLYYKDSYSIFVIKMLN